MMFTKVSQVMIMLFLFFVVMNDYQYLCTALSNIFVCKKDIFYRFTVWQRVDEYKMKIPTYAFSTYASLLISSEVEGVQELSLALEHDEPVSVGGPLYNDASAVKGCLVLSSNVIAHRLNQTNRLFLDRIVCY